jgi:predicted methyltransferase
LASEAELLHALEEVNRKRREKGKAIGGRIYEFSYWKHIRRAIGYIYHKNGSVSLNELVNKLGIHVKDIEDIAKYLEKVNSHKLVSRFGTKLIMTSEGEETAKNLGFKVRSEEVFVPYLREDIEKESTEFIKNELPSPDPYLYQWYFTPQSILKILEYAINEIDVEGMRVACLMTPTIGLALSKTKYCAGNGKEVYVFEKDTDIVDQLEKHNVNAVEYDIADPVPEDYKGLFECIFIDPPYEPDWYYVSFSRAIELLKEPKDKVIYCVTPPPEIAYLMSPGSPPLLTSIIPLAKECGLAIEDIAKGLCQYLTPPYEAFVLVKERLAMEERQEVVKSWRCSDLVKFRVFKNVVSPLPFSFPLTMKERDYKRLGDRKRFLVRALEEPSEKIYVKPDVGDPDVADKWDKFEDEFFIFIREPYSAYIHDVGTWDDSQNRLIRLYGDVAYYTWVKLITSPEVDERVIDQLLRDIKSNFQRVPSEDQVREDLNNFIKKLEEKGLIRVKK